MTGANQIHYQRNWTATLEPEIGNEWAKYTYKIRQDFNTEIE